jgi:hypothetical protein
MMERQRTHINLTDQYPTQNIIMNTEEDDNLLTRIRRLRNSERPILNTYEVWIKNHRHNDITCEIECRVMQGPVTTGVRTTWDT